MDSHWDAVIVGGGAAGLTAGIVLARAQFKTLVVDGGAPRNAPAAHMHGYLSRDGMAPAEFLETGRAEFTGYGGTLTHTAVVDAAPRPDGTFSLKLAREGTIQARAVLVATGLTDELPEVPGLREHWAIDVHHCPHCHGYEVRGRSITDWIAVDQQGATGVPGVWAAGNVVNPRAQVVTAAGAGSVAAIAITGWLIEQDLAAAVGR